MKFIYTGTQGTGKSTILARTPIKNKITEVVRNLSKKGVNINKMGDEEGQRLIFGEYKKLLAQDGSWVSDRGLTDVLAYTIYLHKHSPEKVSKELVKEQLKDLFTFVKEHKDITYVYFPIEFPVVGDGYRDTDEEYRKEIDIIIRHLLNLVSMTIGKQFYTIHGSVEDRVMFIEELIDVTRIVNSINFIEKDEEQDK